MKSIISIKKPSGGAREHKYGAIPKTDDDVKNLPNALQFDAFLKDDSFENSKKRRGFCIATTALGMIGIISALLMFSSRNCDKSNTQSCDSVDHGFQCQPNISRYWGKYSPYFSVPSEISPAVPDQCQVTFAQMLSRHGARDPSLRSTEIYRKLIEDVKSNATSYSDQFSFLKDYNYALGADQLSKFGQQQMINSGIKFYKRYNSIASKILPFLRASGQARVIESAQSWAQGFHKAQLEDPRSSGKGNYPFDIIVLSEDPGSNNTLDHGSCQEFEVGRMTNISSSATSIWASVFTKDIAARLNLNLPGVNFTAKDTISFMSLCPFETVAHELGHVSQFCSLFTEQEWQAYDYYQTLGKYYSFSWGNPLGPTQGVGFTNELISRMTNTPVKDHTSTNSTLDTDQNSFPIGGKTALYADFSHDSIMVSIFSAMGLYNSTPPLSNTTMMDINTLHGFSTSWIVPFASRAYIEKMRCTDINEELVRVIVNDRVLPLETCGADHLGRCKISAFIDSLKFARNGGNWDQC